MAHCTCRRQSPMVEMCLRDRMNTKIAYSQADARTSILYIFVYLPTARHSHMTYVRRTYAAIHVSISISIILLRMYAIYRPQNQIETHIYTSTDFFISSILKYNFSLFHFLHILDKFRFGICWWRADYHPGVVLAKRRIRRVLRSWSRIFFSISASVSVSKNGAHWSASPVARNGTSIVASGASLNA